MSDRESFAAGRAAAADVRRRHGLPEVYRDVEATARAVALDHPPRLARSSAA